MAYAIIHRHCGNHLDDYLPVLVFLKDLPEYWRRQELTAANATTGEKLLTACLAENNLTFEVVKNYAKDGRAIFLFDGLDEVKPNLREQIVNSLAEFRIKYNRCKMVFSSRPHGVDAVVLKRFGNQHERLHTLTMEQVEGFVSKWFEHIYHHGSEVAEKMANEMIGEIRSHDSVSQLLDTPLMLTAICILYYDGRKLPEQRSEFYKKFVENLIYRRFDDPEKVSDFLRHLAFAVHRTRKRGFDKAFALSEMRKVYLQLEEETDKAHRRRLEDKFKRIEEDCGLLKLENGQFDFWHLSFQEFLTAVYIADYEGSIAAYWDDAWFRKVILLYIGYLSISSKASANKLVAEQLDNRKEPSPARCLLAGWSLLDIHKDRRDDVVLVKAKNRLMELWESGVKPPVLFESGEILGWLGDPRDLETFVAIEGGDYTLEGIGNVTITDFELGRYLVTNSWLKKFVDSDGYRNRKLWSPEGRKWLDYTKAKYPLFWHERKWKCPNSPVVGVCWYEADAFCRWLTLNDGEGCVFRLPTEEEWQAAATGKDGIIYPWGSMWKDGACNSREANIEKTSSVGIFLSSSTSDRIHDLAGNVREWTGSDYHAKMVRSDFEFDVSMQKALENKVFDEVLVKINDEVIEVPVIRGASWSNNHIHVRCTFRVRYLPYYRVNFIGFRCARTLK